LASIGSIGEVRGAVIVLTLFSNGCPGWIFHLKVGATQGCFGLPACRRRVALSPAIELDICL
jgi:hypothetical protein